MQQQNLKAVVIGGTGGVGRVLVTELTNSPQWSEVTVIVRRKLDEWDSLPNKHKLNVIQVQSLDELEQTQKWNTFKNYNSFFSVLGTKLSDKAELINKVEIDYLKYGAQIAKLNGIPHFSTITEEGVSEKSKNSWFLIYRVKALVEEYLTLEKFPFLTISRPGAILNRVNYQHFGEFFFKYMPFTSKIEAADLAKAVILDAQNFHTVFKQSNLQPMVKIYSNQDLVNLAK